jgi:phosphodiesterase/alkaline phosphatase D-like protein
MSRFHVTVLLLSSSALSASAGITIDPYLQNPTQTTMQVMWGTDGSMTAPGTLYYGSAPGNYTHSVVSTNTFGFHTAGINGLSPGQTVYYYVESDGEIVGQNDPDYRLTAAPSGDTAFRFAAYGDSRSYPERHAEVVDVIRDTASEFVLHTGDYVGWAGPGKFEEERTAKQRASVTDDPTDTFRYRM